MIAVNIKFDKSETNDLVSYSAVAEQDGKMVAGIGGVNDDISKICRRILDNIGDYINDADTVNCQGMSLDQILAEGKPTRWEKMQQYKACDMALWLTGRIECEYCPLFNVCQSADECADAWEKYLNERVDE